ncbi:MAG: GDP-L-fucose synthase [Desulfobacterales bacterium]|nr:GDP-L-fucose synthase [Desulfobacterales bacterium]
MKKDSRIFVAGGRGLVGSAILRRLEREGYVNISAPSHEELELMNQDAVAEYFQKNKPEYVVLAAAKVGGIHANNTYPAEFIYQNLTIQNNIIHQSWRQKITNLIFLGSSCIYPKSCDQPIREEYLMTGPLEPTNSPYALAKIAGVEMCWSYNRQYGTRFIPVMPTNLYGPNDNFDLETSHVLPALIRKFHEAKTKNMGEVVVWGTGTPKREFLHVDDLADACLFLLESDLLGNGQGKPLFNIGAGKEISIRDLAYMIKRLVGFKGEIVFDDSKPDGTPRKLLDISRMDSLGWQANIGLERGIKETYQWFLTV